MFYLKLNQWGLEKSRKDERLKFYQKVEKFINLILVVNEKDFTSSHDDLVKWFKILLSRMSNSSPSESSDCSIVGSSLKVNKVLISVSRKRLDVSWQNITWYLLKQLTQPTYKMQTYHHYWRRSETFKERLQDILVSVWINIIPFHL